MKNEFGASNINMLNYPFDCPYFSHSINCAKCNSRRAHLCNSIYNCIAPRHCRDCKFGENITRCKKHADAAHAFEVYLKKQCIEIIEHTKVCKCNTCRDKFALFSPCDLCDSGKCFKHDFAKNAYMMPGASLKEIKAKTTKTMETFYDQSIFDNLMSIYRELTSEQITDPAVIDQLREIDKILTEMIGPNFN